MEQTIKTDQSDRQNAWQMERRNKSWSYSIRHKQKTVAISVMENFTGQKGYPASEKKQAWHTDYGAEGI